MNALYYIDKMIIKLNKTGKQVQIVDDDGRVYGTSVSFLMSLIKGTSKVNFLLTSRLPFNLSPDRYKPSPLWIPEGMNKEAVIEELKQTDRSLKTSEDAFGSKGMKRKEDKVRYSDVKL